MTIGADLEEVLDGDFQPALLGPYREVATRSGNPAHQPNGRFGTRGAKPEASKKEGPTKPPADDSVTRRRDAVVDAARTLTDLSPEGVRDFVSRRWSGTKVLTDADVQEFSRDAEAQRVHDVVDALDARLRRTTGRREHGKVVRVEVPRAWLRRALRGLPDDQVGAVVTRLRARGWSTGDIKRFVVRSYDEGKGRIKVADGSS